MVSKSIDLISNPYIRTENTGNQSIVCERIYEKKKRNSADRWSQPLILNIETDES